MGQLSLIWGQQGLEPGRSSIPASSPGSCSKHKPGVSLQPRPALSPAAAKSLPSTQMGRCKGPLQPETKAVTSHTAQAVPLTSGQRPLGLLGPATHGSLGCPGPPPHPIPRSSRGSRPEVGYLENTCHPSSSAHAPGQMARYCFICIGSHPHSGALSGSLFPTHSDPSAVSPHLPP